MTSGTLMPEAHDSEAMNRTGRLASWPDDEIRVWVWRLAPRSHDEVCAAVLSADELAYAARFVYDRHRSRYLHAHAGLRRILGNLLGIPPKAVPLGVDQQGKPRVTGAGRPPLFFNLSHSDDHAALAVSPRAEVGIDIERIRPFDIAVAEHFFSARERRALSAVPESERQEALFNVWTRKEAYLKAIGLGLTVPLDRFDVSVTHPARLLQIGGSLVEAACWRLEHFIPVPGFVGTIAARERHWRLKVQPQSGRNPRPVRNPELTITSGSGVGAGK